MTLGRPPIAAALAAASVLAAAACGDSTDAPRPGPASASASNGTAASTGGGGGSGGGGGHGGCAPGEVVACYDGPEGTADVGACKSGVRTCAADGSGFGACEGQTHPVHDHCVTPADEDCDGNAAPCPGAAAAWSQAFGGAIPTADLTGRAVAVATSGDVLAAFQSLVGGADSAFAVDFGSGPVRGDSFLVRFGPGGDLVEAKSLVGGNVRFAVFAPSGGTLVGGYTNPGAKVDLGGGPIGTGGAKPDVVLGRFDAGGAHVWSKALGKGEPDAPQPNAPHGLKGMAIDAADHIAVVGEFDKTFSLGGPTLTASTSGIYFGVLDGAGAHVWSQGFEASLQPGMSSARGIGLDTSGNVVIAGTFDGTVDFGGGPLTSNGDDIYVAKFDVSGAHLWSEKFGADGAQKAWAIAVDGDDRVVVAGVFNGTLDFGGGPLSAPVERAFLATLAPDGAHVQSRMFDCACDGDRLRIAVGADGSAYAFGHFEGTADFGTGPLVSAGVLDLFAARFGSTGEPIWARRFGDANFQWAGAGASLAVDAGGRAHIVGTYAGTLDFGQGPMPALGFDDAFLAKLEP